MFLESHLRSHSRIHTLNNRIKIKPLSPDLVRKWMPICAPPITFGRSKQVVRDKLIGHGNYVYKHGEDMPEVRNWKR
jgi:hypothetical protein